MILHTLFYRSFAIAAITLFPVVCCNGAPHESASPVLVRASAGKILPGQPKGVKFVTALCADTKDCIWVGTEDSGLWRFDSSKVAAGNTAQAWTQFTRKSTGGNPEKDGPVLTTGTPDVNALGDDCAYALACDRLGRIWVGHLNHGVSVFNGEKWRNYDVVSGPLGERVFAIKTCPVNGDVWMATSAGLARYSLKEDSWSYVTRADGLPSDQVQAIAFSKDGTLYAGTQCEGIAVCVPSVAGEWMKYKNWRTVAGSEALPIAAAGTGLPTNLINDMLVAEDGTVYAATTTGLAWSKDHGATWSYLRGADWLGKAKGLYKPPAKDVIDTAAKKAPTPLLLEDYCTSLAEDAAGNIWVGHWRVGYEAIRPSTDGNWQRIAQSAGKSYAWCLLAPPKAFAAAQKTEPPSDGLSHMLAGNYGGGMQSVEWETVADAAPAASSVVAPAPAKPSSMVSTAVPFPAPPIANAPATAITANATVPPLPSPAKPPTAEELASVMKGIQSQTPMASPPPAAFLREDWMTWGDWTGRYGRSYAMLFAVNAGGGNGFLSQEFGYEGIRSKICGIYDADIGPHRAKDDELRAWIQWPTTNNRRVLYTPMEGIRCEAEWDDHGEAYSYTHDGPDVLFSIKIPDGAYRISLYFFNPNGQGGRDALRDYVVELSAAGKSGVAEPILAKTRVRTFVGGGVYKQFVVAGPAKYTFHIRRNNSFNTLVNGVFFDRLCGSLPKSNMPQKYLESSGMCLDNVCYAPPVVPKNQETDYRIEVAGQLWQQVELQENWPRFITVFPSFRAQACRVTMGLEPVARSQGWMWNLCWWNQPHRQEFTKIMAKGFWRTQKANNYWRTKAERPYSPNTYDTPEEWERHNQQEPQ